MSPKIIKSIKRKNKLTLPIDTPIKVSRRRKSDEISDPKIELFLQRQKKHISDNPNQSYTFDDFLRELQHHINIFAPSYIVNIEDLKDGYINLMLNLFKDNTIKYIIDNSNSNFTFDEFDRFLKDFSYLNNIDFSYFNKSKRDLNVLFHEIIDEAGKFIFSSKNLKENEKSASILKGQYTKFMIRFEDIVSNFKIYEKRKDKTEREWKELKKSISNFEKHSPNIFTQDELKSINKENDYNAVFEAIIIMKEYLDTVGVPAHHDSSIIQPVSKVLKQTKKKKDDATQEIQLKKKKSNIKLPKNVIDKLIDDTIDEQIFETSTPQKQTQKHEIIEDFNESIPDELDLSDIYGQINDIRRQSKMVGDFQKEALIEKVSLNDDIKKLTEEIPLDDSHYEELEKQLERKHKKLIAVDAQLNELESALNENEKQIKKLDSIASRVKAQHKTGKGKSSNHNEIIDNLIEDHMYGSGFFDSIKNFGKKIIKNVSNFIHNDVSQVADNFVNKYGDWKITKILIGRTPIEKFIKAFLNVVSLGKFSTYQYDDLYHLFLIIQIEKDNETKWFLTEKRPSIEIEQKNGFDVPKNTTEIMLDITNGATVKSMFDYSMQTLGKNFSRYDAVNNNCQSYVLSLVHALGITQADSFIKQDITTLTGYTAKLANKVTGITHAFNRLVRGKAKKSNRIKKTKRVKFVI